MSRARPLRLGTRGSALALAQAELARAALAAAGAGEVEIVVLRTSGDRSPDVPATEMTGQGWFTSELEAALIEGRIDVAVHSAKDLPTRLGEGLAAVAHLPRADVRDALVLRVGETGGLEGMAAGSAVGTGSPRRAALLAAVRPDLRSTPIRGNVDTRLRKLDAGEVDGLLIAVAGLDRLSLGDRGHLRLDPRVFVPAPAQGAIALEVRCGTEEAVAVAAVDDLVTTTAVVAERTVLERLGGGCRLPMGAWARVEDRRLVLTAALGGTDGGMRRAELGGDRADPAGLGRRAAEALTA